PPRRGSPHPRRRDSSRAASPRRSPCRSASPPRPPLVLDPHACTLASQPVKFEHVLVVGAGQMGGGIAQVIASSRRRVSLHDVAPGAVERGLATMGKSLEKLAENGGPPPDDVLDCGQPVESL